MIPRRFVLSLFLLFALLLNACSSQPQRSAERAVIQPTPTGIEDGMNEPVGAMSAGEAMMEKTPVSDEHDEMTEHPMPEAATPQTEMEEVVEGMGNVPAFFDVSLTDARTGRSFRISDFQGKVILVETMAMWCPKCLNQQKQVKALHDLLGGREDFVSLGLDVDPNENLDDLRGYVANNSFDWLYAVATADMAREIGQRLGNQFLNPSSTPMFIIDRHGEMHPLSFGIKSAEDLQKALEPFLNDGM